MEIFHPTSKWFSGAKRPTLLLSSHFLLFRVEVDEEQLVGGFNPFEKS